MQQNKVSPNEDRCSSPWTTSSSSEVTAPGKEQLLKSHALCTQTSLFQLFIRDIILLHLDFVKPTYLLLANTVIEPHDPEGMENPEDGNLLFEGPILKNSSRGSGAPLLDCCLPTRFPALLKTSQLLRFSSL